MSHTGKWLGLGLFGAALALGGCASEPVGEPDELTGILASELTGVVEMSDLVAQVEHGIVQPVDVAPVAGVTEAVCLAVNDGVNQACGAAYEAGLAPYGCWGRATFFYANDTPRCAVRLELSAEDWRDPTRLVAFDLTGAPVTSPPRCGNGRLDEGEFCDDGNHDAWDGCDPSCQPEEFQGCEAVIEQKFAVAEVAWVERTLWESPRSHVMVHHRANAMRPMSAASCDAALATANDACAQLQTDMPFVAGCGAQVAYGDDAAGPFCAVRLTVGFQSLAPDKGVFTTSLPGILAFTIR